MTTKLYERSPPVEPVYVNFWWNETGPVEIYTFDGDTYPYTGPETIERYIMHTTPVKTLIEFFAILTEAQIVAEAKHPHVITPPGVEILEYIWDFGDGTEGFGPVVSHEYRVIEPIEIKLTVVDTRGLIWSAARPVNLSEYYTPEFKSAKGFIRSLLGGQPVAYPNDLFPDEDVYPDTDVFPEG